MFQKLLAIIEAGQEILHKEYQAISQSFSSKHEELNELHIELKSMIQCGNQGISYDEIPTERISQLVNRTYSLCAYVKRVRALLPFQSDAHGMTKLKSPCR